MSWSILTKFFVLLCIFHIKITHNFFKPAITRPVFNSLMHTAIFLFYLFLLSLSWFNLACSCITTAAAATWSQMCETDARQSWECSLVSRYYCDALNTFQRHSHECYATIWRIFTLDLIIFVRISWEWLKTTWWQLTAYLTTFLSWKL